MFSTVKVSFITIIAAVVLAVYAQQLPPDCTRSYTVKANDTCNSISASNNVSTFQLADVNQGIIDKACDNLFVGQTLCLGLEGHDCTTTHVVEMGDICDTIASAAEIDPATLLANNPNVHDNCDNLGIGEVLCTASEIIVGGGHGSFDYYLSHHRDQLDCQYPDLQRKLMSFRTVGLRHSHSSGHRLTVEWIPCMIAPDFEEIPI
ncbi:hypothetical protein QCA50_008424 [Cerrena zonata]|uniref:LysM domain-containing protein n=1 Tax=Cerrena zonata TaxID=2478898 RepID=A0AAW0G9K7_9APHY